jgi:hypothetical protein
VAQPLSPKVVAWINREAAALAHRGVVPGSPRETDLLQHWQTHRPKMLAMLQEAGVAEKVALVLDEKRWEARQRAIQQGMPATDAEEQATREWLLQEPEDEKNPDQPLRALISG